MTLGTRIRLALAAALLGLVLFLGATVRSAPTYRTVAFTDPRYDSAPESCAAHFDFPLLIDEGELESVALYGRWRFGGDWLIDSHLPVGLGMPDSFRFIYTPQIVAVWVTATKTNGKTTCPSNAVIYDGTVSVDPTTPSFELLGAVTRIYDVSGRLITQLTEVGLFDRPEDLRDVLRLSLSSGVYFARRGNAAARRIVVIR